MMTSDDPDRVMIQIQWWSRSSDVDPAEMIQIKWWSRSSDDDLDRVMIQIQMKMTWRCRWPDDIEKKTCADKLCRENTFLVKRECWCNCNFWIYSLVYLMYYSPMFILGCVCNVIESCHTLMFILGIFYNEKVMSSHCGKPSYWSRVKVPTVVGP